MPRALPVFRGGEPAHTPPACDRPKPSLPCCSGPVEGISEEHVGPPGSLHFGQYIQPTQDLVAPFSGQSQVPVAPHTSLGCPGPCPHSALRLAFPLALPASDAHGGVTWGMGQVLALIWLQMALCTLSPTHGFGILRPGFPTLLVFCSPRGNRQSALSGTDQLWAQS